MVATESVPGEPRDQAQRLLCAWVLFSTVLLCVAALFLIPAALGGAWGTGEVLGSRTIARFLVGHIFFSLVLACTAFVVVLWMRVVLGLEASRAPALPSWIGFWLAVAGSLLATIGTFGWWGEPVLTEFVPVVVEPAFLSGLGLFMAGVAVTTACFIYAVTSAEITRMPLIPFGMLCTAAMMVATGLAGVATITRLFGDWFAFQLAWRTPQVLFQAIFWGPAHLIQFAVVGAMVAAWILLLPQSGLQGRGERLGRLGFLALVVFAGITLIVLYAVDPLALPTMSRLNIGISDAQTLPALLMGILVLRAAFRGGRRPGGPALIFSLLLFAWGILTALVGAAQANPAWVPSHYQAMISGAVLVAFMGATTELLPLLGRRPPGRIIATAQIALYGGGILAVSLAMLWAALAGGERHGYFVSVPATGPAILLWIGGVAAGLGVLAFTASTVRALLGGARGPAPAAPQDAAAVRPIGQPVSPGGQRT